MAAHSHDGGMPHSHDHNGAAVDHGHTHEVLDGPGSFMGREMPIIEGRNWEERAFTVGIGGYVPRGFHNPESTVHEENPSTKAYAKKGYAQLLKITRQFCTRR